MNENALGRRRHRCSQGRSREEFSRTLRRCESSCILSVTILLTCGHSFMRIYFTETDSSTRQFFETGLAHLPRPQTSLHFVEEPDEILDDATIVSPFIYTSIDKAFLDAHPNLRCIASRSVTLCHIDLDTCASHGIPVYNAPAYDGSTAAEHTFALILALSRKILEATALKRRSASSLQKIQGFDLKNKTLGVIGAGRIGKNVIQIARGFDMNILAADPQPDPHAKKTLGIQYKPFNEVLAAADILTLHIPASPETHYLLNERTLSLCKKGVLIINTAAGSLIDTQALIQAIESGHVAGAGLDVLEEESLLQHEPHQLLGAQIVQNIQKSPPPEHLSSISYARIREIQNLMINKKLLALPNVIVTPHVAYHSTESICKINQATLDNILHFLQDS